MKKIEDKDVGLGFKPTVRNMIAVIMASAEAFIRLLDDVHTNAWNVKYDPVRKSAILDNPSSAPSSETRDNVVYREGSLLGNTAAENSQIPVYPWPQYFVETPDDKKGRFQLKYIGDPTEVDRTQGGNYSKWPEVEFVEEYMKGLTQKFQNPIAPPPLDNQRDTNVININAIEFPSAGIAYANKEEVKFFYEIWERQFLTSHYSGLVRANSNQINDLIKLNIETEVNNVKDGLGVSSPYITFKLKNYGLNATNYPTFLNNISNIVMRIYVAESTMLRVKKKEEVHGMDVSLNKDILDVLVYDAAEFIRKEAKDCINSFVEDAVVMLGCLG